MRKILKKLLAFVLVLALSLSVVPFSISAESLSDSILQEVDSHLVESTDNEPEILYEINIRQGTVLCLDELVILHYNINGDAKCQELQESKVIAEYII